MSNYNADSQSIGDWMGREDEAIDLWNDNIAPVLADMHKQAENENGDTDWVAYKQNWAWEQFCSRVDLDNSPETAVITIVKELTE